MALLVTMEKKICYSQDINMETFAVSKIVHYIAPTKNLFWITFYMCL